MEDDEVAVIVIAETEEACDEGLKALNPQWEVRQHIVDILEGRKPDAPVIRDNPRGKGNVTIAANSRGDVEAGFKEADQIIEYDFNMPAFCGHVPNPYASVAYWYFNPLQGSEQQSLHIEGAVWTASGGKDSVGGMSGFPGNGEAGRPIPRREVLRLGAAESTANHAASRQEDRKTGPHGINPQRDVRLQYESALLAPEGRI